MFRVNLRFSKNIAPNLSGLSNFPQNNLIVSDGLTDGRTDELIWGGLGNLRFLQVKHSLARGLEEQRNFEELLTESVGRVHFP
jgi:hypothetical protein